MVCYQSYLSFISQFVLVFEQEITMEAPRKALVAAAGIVVLLFAARVQAGDVPPEIQWPALGGTINLDFGARWVLRTCDGYPARHAGIDIGLPRGAAVLAADVGVVRYANGTPNIQGGQWIVVEHSIGDLKYTTSYWHVIPRVAQGQLVARGEQIATVDGLPDNPHFHFGLRLAPYSLISHNLALPATRACGPLTPQFPEYFVSPTRFTSPPAVRRGPASASFVRSDRKL